MLSNCYLLALLLLKTGFMTGLIPGIFFFYAAGKLVRALRVPTPNQLETWTEPEKAELRRAA